MFLKAIVSRAFDDRVVQLTAFLLDVFFCCPGHVLYFKWGFYSSLLDYGRKHVPVTSWF